MKRNMLQWLMLLLVTALVACSANSVNISLDGDSESELSLTDGDDLVADGDSSDGDVSSLSYAIVSTNQSSCYDDWNNISCPSAGEAFFGQDAQYDGAGPLYRDNGDGTVTDLVTGLMWQQDPGEKQYYDEAIDAVTSFKLAGYTDWRVPTIKELYSLILFSGKDVDPMAEETGNMTPFIDDDTFAFSYGDTSTGDRVIDSQWVTSSIYTDTVMGNEECFFGVNFADGRIKCYPTSNKTYFAIYVRGGNNYGKNDFEDNGDNTITDHATGLMWAQQDSGDTLNWGEALDFCESLQLAGFDDWTLPDVKQLQSLVDYSRSPGKTNSAAIDPIFQTTEITNEMDDSDYGFYWSRTTHVNQQGGSDAAYVSFGRALGYMNDHYMDVHGAGAQRSDPKSGNPEDLPLGFGPQGDVRRIYNFARCVRNSGSFNANPAGNDPVIDGDQSVVDGDAPVGPTSCTQDSDCLSASACPPDAALGCSCSSTPQGLFCVPDCNQDSDCPEPPDETLICSQDGMCVPE